MNNYNTDIVPTVLSDVDESSTSNTEDLILNKFNSNSNSAPAKWTDANAVRALISRWKNHENDFKNILVKNSKVWQIITDNLKKENPLWNFIGTQYENKFKDVRKSYTKVKDHNNQSGAELKTYKFYDEMEAALSEKPISISSTLKKKNLKRAISPCSSTSDEIENISPIPNRKKSKLAKELDNWRQKLESKEREQAKMQRHKEKMEKQDKYMMIFKEQMEKLLEKL